MMLLLCNVLIASKDSRIILQAFPKENELLWDRNNCSIDILGDDVIKKLYSVSKPNFINSGIIFDQN